LLISTQNINIIIVQLCAIDAILLITLYLYNIMSTTIETITNHTSFVCSIIFIEKKKNLIKINIRLKSSIIKKKKKKKKKKRKTVVF